MYCIVRLPRVQALEDQCLDSLYEDRIARYTERKYQCRMTLIKTYEGNISLDFDQLNWDANGLLPVVVQNPLGEVLMFAYMNRQALAETIASGYSTFYSRSRQQLWQKGEQSGNRQRVLEIRIDCDLDCLLLKVEQTGGAFPGGRRFS